LGVKHADWDKKDGYFVPRDVYNSYFYVVEDPNVNVLDKFKLHGKESVQWLDGGSALHCNLDEHLSFEQYRHLIRVSAQLGCNYFTFNIPNTICNSCGKIDKRKLSKCPDCGSEDLDYLTRIIGYLKRVYSFSVKRKEEVGIRYYGILR
jgi:ribonucleoside-triphosphate reductase